MTIRTIKLDSQEVSRIFEHRLLTWSRPHSANAHIIERDVREIYKNSSSALTNDQFVEAWMQWKATQHGLPHTVKDESLIQNSGGLAQAALRCGVLTSYGVRRNRLIWLAQPDRTIYEKKHGSDARLRLPPHKLGSPRLSLDKRHAEVALPVVQDLLKRIAAHPKTKAIPLEWTLAKDIFSDDPNIPENEERFVKHNIEALEQILRKEPIANQVLWICHLRIQLMNLGDRGPTGKITPRRDIEALSLLA